MPFQEKSSWIMTVALLLGGVVYFGIVTSISSQLGQLAPPMIPVIVVYTVVLIAIAIIGHIVAAATAPKDANSDPDERERLIIDRAARISGDILGAGVILSLGHFLLNHDGDVLFYSIFAALMLAQTAEYVLRIWLHRRAF